MKNFNIALKIKAKNGILQKFIDNLGWSQSDFARYLNLSPTYVGKWFNLTDYPRSEKLMEKVLKLIAKTEEEVFPNSIRSQEFLAIEKSMTLFREVDLEYLPFNKIPEIEYMPDFDGFELKDSIRKVLKSLTSKEEKIIKMRFGIGSGYEHTYEEIGNILKLSKERVRQIEAKASRKLRQPSRLRVLKEFMADT